MGIEGQVEAAVEAAGEFLRARAMSLGVPSMFSGRPTDYSVGLPFLDQRFDLIPVGNAVLRLQGAQLAGLAGYHLADRDADLFGAVVESQNQAAGPSGVPRLAGQAG